MSKPRSKTARTKPAKPQPKERKPKRLDEETSAYVIAEYLSIEGVEAAELDAIMDVPHGLSHREIALTFRISEALDVSPAFEMAPRWRTAFARAQEYLQIKAVADAHGLSHASRTLVNGGAA
jgi:hypothetical protein